MRIVTAVLAHAGAPLAPHDLLSAWSFDPLLVLATVAGAWLYVRGGRRLRATIAGARALPRWRIACFWGAIATTLIAIASPIDALAGALFGAHMFQHLLLTMLVPPLLVVSRPLLVMSMGMRPGVRRVANTARVALTPPGRTGLRWAVAALLVHAGTLWLWHVPVLYELALRNEALHLVEHATLLLGAVPFWWLVADARGAHANLGGVFAVFGGVLQSGALAGLLTFSGAAWYAAHAAAAPTWGLTGLEDQHLAGGLMWFPGGLAYFVGGSVLFLRWLSSDERRVLVETVTERGTRA